MWTFKALGENDKPNGFEATFDGPVEDTAAAMLVIEKRAQELAGDALVLCTDAVNMAKALTEDVENGKRRFSMNLEGGVNKQGGWSLSLRLNLADDPTAR